MPTVALLKDGDDRDKMVNMLKKGSCYMALYIRKLVFLDVCNYLPAGGFSFAKYIRTYGGPAYQGGKSFFLYQYVDDLAWLRDPLPPYAALYSSLRCKNTLEEGLGLDQGQRNYADLCRLWVCKDMTLLRYLMVHYNNCDVVPFLTALQKQCNIYKEVIQDMAAYARSYKCIHCSAWWGCPQFLQCPQATCQRANCYHYKGGVWKGGPYEPKL